MRMSTKLSLAVCLVLVAACGDSPTDGGRTDLVLAPLAKVLDASNASDLDAVSADQSTITFFEGGTFDGLSTGSILVAGVTPATPNGLLRRVVSVTQAGGRIVAFTEPATLTEAVQEGVFGYHGPAVTGAIPETAFRASVVGVRGGASAAFGELYMDIPPLVLYDADGQPGTEDEITVSGQLTFRPDLDVDVDIGFFSVKRLLLSYEDHPTITLNVSSGMGVGLPSLDVTREVARWALPAIPIPGTPFVLTPVAIARVGLTGSVETGLTVGAVLSAEVIAGIECTDGTCRDFHDVTPGGDLEPTVDFTAAATLEAFVKGAFDVSINGLLGGNLAGTAYLKANVNPLATPWWTAHAGVKVGAGLSAVWGLVSIGYHDFFDRSVLIASATTHAPTVTSVNPTSGPTSGGTPVTIMGTDFVNVTAVTIGGVALIPQVVNRLTITGTTPASATAGAKDVVVTTSLGSGTCTGCFTYTTQGAPVSPSSLVATAVSASQVALAWEDNSDNEDGFQIERCTGVGCTGFTPLTSVGPNVRTYLDGGLTPGTVYSYRVRAYNAGGGSGFSNTASRATPGAPVAPSSLVAAVVSASQINLTWQDNSSNEDGFQVERCTGVGCTGFTPLTSVGSNVRTYPDGGLTAGTVYMYRVRAYGAGGSSVYSNTAIATTRVTITGRIAFIWGTSLNVMNSDGSVRELTTQASPMSWSPDGTKVAFGSRRDGNWEVYVMNADGSGVATRLTNHPAEDNAPSWSPDGARIAFGSNRDGNYELYVMNVDGSGVATRLTNHPAWDGPALMWSPDGTKIAFNSQRDGNVEVYVINADGSGVPARLTNDPARNVATDWSPDGAQILFESDRDGNYEVYAMNADGSGVPTRLTNNPASDAFATWSPDGTKIVFSSVRSGLGSYELHVMNADGSAVTRMGVLGIFAQWGP